MAEDVGAWDEADRAHYAIVLASDGEAFDTFVIESFGGINITEGRLFMPLEQFKKRAHHKKSEIGVNTAIEVRQANDKVLTGLIWMMVKRGKSLES